MPVRRERRVAFVHCAGGSQLREGVSWQGLPHDCNKIKELHPEGINACTFGCLGGGTCVAACPRDAIEIRNGVAHVLRGRCAGCGLCVRACPQHIISLELPQSTISVRCSNGQKAPVARKACTNSCTGCGVCELSCPANAIRVVDGCAQINEENCLACGMCATKCPRGAIHDHRGIFTVE